MQPQILTGVRDRALVLIGYAGAFRRSELAAIKFDDLSFPKKGLVIDLRRSKTDLEASGRKVGIPFGVGKTTCPVRTLRCLLSEGGITKGAGFRAIDRHGHIARRGLNRDSVGWLLKRAAPCAGRKAGQMAAHSLRAGHVTQDAVSGVNERDILRQTGHKSAVMLAICIRIGQLFTHNAAAGLGI